MSLHDYGNGDDVNNKSPRRTNNSDVEEEDLMDDTYSHLQKITDYKSYCKVRQREELFEISKKRPIYISFSLIFSKTLNFKSKFPYPRV